MARLQEAGFRGVSLREDDVPGGPEACRPSGSDKQVSAVPSVEAHTEGVGFQDAVHLEERRREPVCVVVVCDAVLRERGGLLFGDKKKGLVGAGLKSDSGIGIWSYPLLLLAPQKRLPNTVHCHEISKNNESSRGGGWFGLSKVGVESRNVLCMIPMGVDGEGR